MTEKTTNLLRELESHLAALEVMISRGMAPRMSATCARRIFSDVLESLDVPPDVTLPKILDTDEAWTEAESAAVATTRVIQVGNN